MIFIQLLISFLQWLGVNWASFLFTEYYSIPFKYRWLDFYPIKCNKCLSFWLGIFTFTIGFVCTDFQNWWYLGLGILLTALTAIGRTITEKKGLVRL